MVVTGIPRQKSRRYDGAEAAAFLRFDLLREQRQQGEFRVRLDTLRRSVSKAVAAGYRRMFNNESVKVTMSQWREHRPDADFWLAATTTWSAEQEVYLGLSTEALFSLSDLFFTNQVNHGVESARDAVEGQRNVSETEERLARRLFLYQLTELAQALGLPAKADWEIRRVAEQPDTALPCCDISFSTEQVQCEWQLCWPTALDAAPAIDTPPDLGDSLRHALKRVPVRLRVEVAALSSVLGRLSDLKAGEVLPLELHDQAVARIGAVNCCRGRVAENDGSLVMQVTNVMGTSDGGR